MPEVILKSETETVEFAKSLSRNLKAGDVIAFSGDLGSGKTFVCREIIKNLCGYNSEVQSPTFNILKTYQSPNFIIYHFDLYRLKSLNELYELGLEEAFYGVCLIEWPDIIMKLLPDFTIKVNIQIIDESSRMVSFNA